MNVTREDHSSLRLVGEAYRITFIAKLTLNVSLLTGIDISRLLLRCSKAEKRKKSRPSQDKWRDPTSSMAAIVSQCMQCPIVVRWECTFIYSSILSVWRVLPPSTIIFKNKTNNDPKD
jgi:hypothetical protein